MAGNGTTLTDMESEWGSAAVLILAVLLGVFIVVASLGNLLVMVSILITRKQCDRGYIFIFNLSVVDFLTAVCIMPISVSTLIHGDFIYSHAACVFNGFMVQVLFITSIHTLMYMAIYRYLAICDPFTPVHICKVGLMIAASWTLAILISSLSFGILGHFVYKPFTTQCGPVYPQDVKGWINIGIVASICFLLPLAIIVFVYVLLFRKAHRLFTRLEDPSYSSYSREVHVEQRRISITCIIIVVSFLICWTPIFAYLNYASFVHDKKSIPTLINPIGNVANREIHADGGNTEIVYTKGETKSIITLVCGAVKSGEVRFIRSSSDDKLAYFEWETSLVCAPVEVTCSGTFPNGTAYDLSSLISHGSNYVGHNSYKDLYYINICHRLTATDDAVNCPAGAAACMVSGSGSDKRYISLGQLDPTQPVLTNLGTALFVQYKNGDVCASNSSYNWSSLIMFKCNPDKKVLGEVEVARKSDDCRQDFLIETAAACFDKATVTTPAPTMSCENIPGLDTTELKKQYEIDADEHTYYLNFCGASGEKATCNSTSNFGVCQVSKNSQQEEVLAGLPTTSATQVNERIIFNYIDGNKCMHDPNQSPRNVVLEIFCSQYAEVDSVPVFHRETVTDCTYYMYWPRVELCRTDKIVCTVTQDGHIMDLSALSGRTHYAQASPALRDYQDKLYQISVCKPLPLSSSNKCPGAAVCETDNSNLEIYKDLGFLSDGLRVMDGEDGHLQLIYNTTISCSGNSSQTVSSVITFSCGDTMGSPVLDEADGCTYSFTWQTSEACHADNSAPTADCKITSLTNGRVIDLSPFKGQTYKPSGYSLRVCEGLPSEDLNGCPAGTAVCQAGVAKGSVMSPLQFHGHDILLRYNSSTACDKGGTWSTTIEFVCDITVGKGEPKLMWTYDHSCELLFQWNTNHVCNPDCQLSHLGLLYDFSHLTLHTDFYQVSADNFEFYINICKDLPLSKAGSEGTCVSVVKDGQTYALAQTSTLVSTYNEKGNLTLSYNGSDSSICGSSGQMPHVLFQLSCSNTQGRPTFKAEDTGTCTFVFQWSTYVACADDDRSAIQVTNGQFVDSISQLTYSIAALLNRRVDIMDGEYTYSLSLNQVLPNEESLGPNCNKGDTRVCQYKPEFSRSLGQQITSYYYQDEQLQMVLNSTSVCGRVPNTYVQTIVNFVCNDKVPEDSNPEFRVETTSCHYLFEWHTPIICEPIQPAQPLSKNGNVATAVSIVAALLLLIALIVGIIIYKKKHRRRWDGVYEYSGVAQDDDTTGLISANRGSTPRFYDDDDEDMII